MTLRQNADLNSFLGVEDVVTQFTSQLTKFPEITTAAALITTKKGVINALSVIQKNGTKDKTAFKNAIRDEIEAKFDELVTAIRGSVGDNPGLKTKYKDIAPSSLKDSRKAELTADVQLVVDDARTILTKLDRYDINEAFLVELETLCPAHDKAAAGKTTAEGESTSATADLAKIFDEINKALREADAIVEPLEKKMPEFFKAWFEARKKQGV